MLAQRPAHSVNKVPLMLHLLVAVRGYAKGISREVESHEVISRRISGDVNPVTLEDIKRHRSPEIIHCHLLIGEVAVIADSKIVAHARCYQAAQSQRVRQRRHADRLWLQSGSQVRGTWRVIEPVEDIKPLGH